MRIILAATLVFASVAANAQAVQCQTYANGQVICTPAGGGQSIYGK